MDNGQGVSVRLTTAGFSTLAPRLTLYTKAKTVAAQVETADPLRGELTIHLPSGDFMIRAIFTLAVMNTLQTLIMGGWLLLREPQQIVKVAVTWRSSSVVGVLSVLGSACWAMGFALQSTAYIRALGQIELVFTFIASRYMLHEKPTLGELIGSVLVVGGVVLVLLGH